MDHSPAAESEESVPSVTFPPDIESEENPRAASHNPNENVNQNFVPPPLVSSHSSFGEKLSDNSTVRVEWIKMVYNIETQSFPPSLPCCIPCRMPPLRGLGPFKVSQKKILQGVSGYAKPGRFLAIMGASGSGKTTLLNILSRRLNNHRSLSAHHNISGDILINGNVLTAHAFRKVSAFVLQEDALLPHLTVEESLFYAAQLRLPLALSMKAKQEIVERTMGELGLMRVRNTIIGNQFVRGISGGQKRRVSIGVQLLTDPRVLFLDEPTSGLDSKTALSIVETLSNLAKNGNRTIVCTIHQPRSQIFHLFDDLFILASGVPVYCGPAADALPYFSSRGYPCPIHENPPDFFIDLITEEISNNQEKKEETKERIEELKEAFKENNESFQPDPNVKPIDVKSVGIPAVSWLNEVYWIAHRSTINLMRNAELLRVRFIQAIFMGILLGCIFYNLKDNQAAINSRAGLLFFLLVNCSITEGIQAIQTFALERLIFYVDRETGAVRVSSYYIGRSLPEFFLQFIIPTITITLAYWMAGLDHSWSRFGFSMFIVWCCCFVANSFGLFLSAAFTYPIAGILAPIFVVINMLFGGFFARSNTIPSWLSWAEYLSFVRYGFMAFAQVQFNGKTFICSSSEYVYSDNGQKSCPITHGYQVIDEYDAHKLTPWECVAVLFGFILFFRFLAFLALKYMKPKA